MFKSDAHPAGIGVSGINICQIGMGVTLYEAFGAQERAASRQMQS